MATSYYLPGSIQFMPDNYIQGKEFSKTYLGIITTNSTVFYDYLFDLTSQAYYEKCFPEEKQSGFPTQKNPFLFLGYSNTEKEIDDIKKSFSQFVNPFISIPESIFKNGSMFSQTRVFLGEIDIYGFLKNYGLYVCQLTHSMYTFNSDDTIIQDNFNKIVDFLKINFGQLKLINIITIYNYILNQIGNNNKKSILALILSIILVEENMDICKNIIKQFIFVKDNTYFPKYTFDFSTSNYTEMKNVIANIPSLIPDLYISLYGACGDALPKTGKGGYTKNLRQPFLDSLLSVYPRLIINLGVRFDNPGYDFVTKTNIESGFRKVEISNRLEDWKPDELNFIFLKMTYNQTITEKNALKQASTAKDIYKKEYVEKYAIEIRLTENVNNYIQTKLITAQNETGAGFILVPVKGEKRIFNLGYVCELEEYGPTPNSAYAPSHYIYMHTHPTNIVTSSQCNKAWPSSADILIDFIRFTSLLSRSIPFADDSPMLSIVATMNQKYYLCEYNNTIYKQLRLIDETNASKNMYMIGLILNLIGGYGEPIRQETIKQYQVAAIDIFKLKTIKKAGIPIIQQPITGDITIVDPESVCLIENKFCEFMSTITLEKVIEYGKIIMNNYIKIVEDIYPNIFRQRVKDRLKQKMNAAGISIDIDQIVDAFTRANPEISKIENLNNDPILVANNILLESTDIDLFGPPYTPDEENIIIRNNLRKTYMGLMSACLPDTKLSSAGFTSTEIDALRNTTTDENIASQVSFYRLVISILDSLKIYTPQEGIDVIRTPLSPSMIISPPKPTLAEKLVSKCPSEPDVSKCIIEPLMKMTLLNLGSFTSKSLGYQQYEYFNSTANKKSKNRLENSSLYLDFLISDPRTDTAISTKVILSNGTSVALKNVIQDYEFLGSIDPTDKKIKDYTTCTNCDNIDELSERFNVIV